MGPIFPELTLERSIDSEPLACPMRWNGKPCGEKPTGVLICRGYAIAFTCEGHGNAAGDPYRWERRS